MPFFRCRTVGRSVNKSSSARRGEGAKKRLTSFSRWASQALRRRRRARPFFVARETTTTRTPGSLYHHSEGFKWRCARRLLFGLCEIWASPVSALVFVFFFSFFHFARPFCRQAWRLHVPECFYVIAESTHLAGPAAAMGIERESLFHFRGGILCLILLFITLGFGSDSFGGIGRNFLRQESILSVAARFVLRLKVSCTHCLTIFRAFPTKFKTVVSEYSYNICSYYAFFSKTVGVKVI